VREMLEGMMILMVSEGKTSVVQLMACGRLA